MIKGMLYALFGSILVGMLAVTGWASQRQPILDAWSALWPDLWFRATLADAYFGFLVVFVWIGWRERTLLTRLVWFVLLMTLGNIAIAVYFLIALFQLEGDGIDGLFRRKASLAAGSLPRES